MSIVVDRHRSSSATTRPWLTICRIAPSEPSARRAKIPAVMKPSWATDEYRDQWHVGLGEGHHRAVEDRGQGDHQDDRLELDRRIGEERQDDAQEAVGADLGEHPGEDDEVRQRRRPVGVGHPAVQQEAGILTRKAAAKNQKIQRWLSTPRPCCWIAAIEKVRWPPWAEMIAVAIAPTSISSEPISV